ncbi:hypothetical protein N657DRAFT_578504 [Parathielavia appendiculata]|uniref:Uncharacterized protein n=1 Tax=Parathielavia appendiculata TaxID=2587402 RepID=A0AAN6Z141_9PEZI|nr:hypothetical protein N657DRAFT_578504 [Parathielavia appendiculata]
MQALPEGNEEKAQPAPIPSNEESQQQHDQYQQHHHQQHQQPQRQQRQHHQHQYLGQDADPISQPYSGRPANTPLPEASAKLSPERAVERLAHRLSEQYLQLSSPCHDQLQHQPTPSLPSSIPSLVTSELRAFHRWAESEVRGQRQHRFLDAKSDDHTVPWLPISRGGIGEPIEVDEAYQEKLDGRRFLDVRRPRRQTSGQLGGSSSTRPVDRRLEAMIASGTQCNVHSEPRPTPNPSKPTSNIAIVAQPAFIEPDPDCAMPTLKVEVDDANAGGVLGPLGDLADEGISLRYASGPGGVRKYTVEGFALRYRLSADVALRCANVVRSRPRMRRRHKKANENTGSPAVMSAVSSPAMSSAESPSLPPARLPPQKYL